MKTLKVEWSDIVLYVIVAFLTLLGGKIGIYKMQKEAVDRGCAEWIDKPYFKTFTWK